MHVINQLDIAAPLLHIPACKHSLLRADHDLRWQACHLTKQPRIIHKARNIAGHESVHHATNTDDLARKDTSVNRCLGIVAHDATQELHIGRRLTKAVLHVHCAIGVLQIAIACPRSEIDPATEITMAEETMVLFVAIRLNDRRFHLATDLGRVR